MGHRNLVFEAAHRLFLGQVATGEVKSASGLVIRPAIYLAGIDEIVNPDYLSDADDIEPTVANWPEMDADSESIAFQENGPFAADDLPDSSAGDSDELHSQSSSENDNGEMSQEEVEFPFGALWRRRVPPNWPCRICGARHLRGTSCLPR